MKNGHLKLKSKYCLLGNNLNAIFLMIISLLLACICGVACAGTQFLLNIDSINSSLISTWSYLPSIVRLVLAIVFLLCSIFLIAPMRTGREAWFLSSAHSFTPKASRVIFWYKPKNAFKSVRFWCFIFILKTMWAIVFFSPGLLTLTTCIVMLFDSSIEINLLIAMLAGGIFLSVIGLVFFQITVQRYSLASIALAKTPNVSILESVKKSTAQMNGQCIKLFIFKLSFLPWFITCILILPIAYVWPYYKQSCLQYGLYLIKGKPSKSFHNVNAVPAIDSVK